MLIAFVGDLHGRVFHAIAAVLTLQREIGRPLDLIVQVGDLGEFTDLTQAEASANPHLAADSAEADLARLLSLEGAAAQRMPALRQHLAGPLHFIRGNHEDFAWLRRLPVDEAARMAPAGPFDLFRYVPDGTILEIQRLRVAFLGGVEEEAGDPGIDLAAYQSLLDLGPGQFDVLVTHQGPYGSSVSYRGDVHGSPLISRLIERAKPAFHVAGHAHQFRGVQRFGPTVYLGLDGLVASPVWYPDAHGLQPGSLALLDTDTSSLAPVTSRWLASIDRTFDFDAWARALPREIRPTRSRNGG